MDVISQLLDAGVDVNRRNVLGMNALLLVSGFSDERLVKLVLDAGADPTSANDFGHSALHLAIVGKRSQLKVYRQSISVVVLEDPRGLIYKSLSLNHKVLENFRLVGWLSGRTSVSERRTFTGLHRAFS